MLKREASMFAAQGVDVDAPRAKRHKPASATVATSASPPRKGKGHQQSQDATAVDGEGVKKEEGESEDRDAVKEKGMRLWQTVKDAVNKENRVLSNDFLRLPSKRQYPDYYQQIKAPISLDEIKQKLETKAYSSFDEVKQDLERCFRNAKRYNMKDSQIWKDAKQLHKLVLKEAASLSGIEPPAADAEDAEDQPTDQPGASSDVEEIGDKKKKHPNMNRLLKTRLEKLVNFTDKQGRSRSTEFMELPNKKKWPIYYKTIKKPQCLENIFKKLKRKEYPTAVDFANDVELVFSNALEFNQEHSEVWEDALALRDYFRQLMSDLPQPFTIPAYASPDHSTKIKLKMHPASQPAAGPSAIPIANTTTPGTLLLRVPGQSSTSATPTPKVLTKAAPSPKPATPALPAHTPPAIAGAPSIGGLQPAKFVQPSYYPGYQKQPTLSVMATSLPNTNNIHRYVKPAVQPQATSLKPLHLQTQISLAPAPAPTPAPPPAIAPAVHLATVTSVRTPTPTVTGNQRPLRSVSLQFKPSSRRIELSHKDRVRIWALRLAHGDTSVYISDVKFLMDQEEEEEGSEDEEQRKDHDVEMVVEEEEEEEEEEPEKPVKRARGRPRKKKRGKGVEDVKGKGKVVPTSKGHEELQVKLNGVVVKGRVGSGRKSAWTVDLHAGTNLVEVGEKGSAMWKVYLERPLSA
ncbi:unnamed protein product [Somion occarium]|uniref:Bromo domain-containing protein n=1 Tax=Somion occarium TaxID=3059160 RepID=A0ABP1CJY9_9APHY